MQQLNKQLNQQQATKHMILRRIWRRDEPGGGVLLLLLLLLLRIIIIIIIIIICSNAIITISISGAGMSLGVETFRAAKPIMRRGA